MFAAALAHYVVPLQAESSRDSNANANTTQEHRAAQRGVPEGKGLAARVGRWLSHTNGRRTHSCAPPFPAFSCSTTHSSGQLQHTLQALCVSTPCACTTPTHTRPPKSGAPRTRLSSALGSVAAGAVASSIHHSRQHVATVVPSGHPALVRTHSELRSRTRCLASNSQP